LGNTRLGQTLEEEEPERRRRAREASAAAGLGVLTVRPVSKGDGQPVNTSETDQANAIGFECVS